MNPDTGHLVAHLNAVPEEKRNLYSKVPKHLVEDAKQELDGREDVFVDPAKQSALNAWAATKRKKNRAKAKLAKASRKRNRVAR